MTVPLSLQTTENLATPIRGLRWYYLNWSIDAYPICHNQVNSLELDTVIPGSNADVDHANLGFRKRLSLHPPRSHGLHLWSSGTSPRLLKLVVRHPTVHLC
jgi:hypothetical protein